MIFETRDDFLEVVRATRRAIKILEDIWVYERPDEPIPTDGTEFAPVPAVMHVKPKCWQCRGCLQFFTDVIPMISGLCAGCHFPAQESTISLEELS